MIRSLPPGVTSTGSPRLLPSRRSLIQTLLSVVLLGQLPGVLGQGYPPDEAADRMTAANGLAVRLIASEPLVRQPVCIEFDDRGRLWVIQYLQYPNPEGLQRVNVDRYSRTEYDRVPKPPPHGPRGADRITILSDSSGDGQMDTAVDFVDGLNLASGMAFGHGGVFVLNVPYLLFYPDRNRDDVPDDDPQVLLTGFGMQDAHSVANSLTWGPDGWLYGCQGSTVTSKIRGIEFQQGVWRYHVETDRFELFCEGGGNAWGLDFNPQGDLYYSTNYGGYVMVHGVQGGYFVKSFAKHGELHNPFSYGYFGHTPHTGFHGGHVTVGGLVYQGGSLPEQYNGTYIGGDLLGHGVNWHQISRRGSTVSTTHGDELLAANDTWFAPTDVITGPDGALYVSDWHDQRTAHPDPDADWDRSNGRIYRLASSHSSMSAPFDYSEFSLDELLQRLQHPNQWHVRRARQELVRRQSSDAANRLRDLPDSADTQQVALESLWTLLSLGAVDEPLAMRLLDSPYPGIRFWALRFLGDQGHVTDHSAHRLDEFAEQEPDVRVRQQLACTARRLPAPIAVPMINANINRDIDNDDPYLPLLWWWAVEQHSVSGRDEVLRRFVRPTAWKSRLGSEFLLPRLIRRYAAEGTDAGLDSVVALLTSAPSDDQRDGQWEQVLLGLQQSSLSADQEGRLRSHPLAEMITTHWTRRPDDFSLLRLAIRLGHPEAGQRAERQALDKNSSDQLRISSLQALTLAPSESLVPSLLSIIESDSSEPVRIAALKTLSGINTTQAASRLIEPHRQDAPAELKNRIRNVLLGRTASAALWLAAVDQGKIPAADTPIEQIRRVSLLNDAELDRLVIRHWGRLQAASREEKLAEVRRLNNDLRAATGDPSAGQILFRKHCSSCHQLFGEGKKIGPDLTSANRSDRQALLVSLVDPSSVIRREYTPLVIQTTDGRVLSGLPVSEDDSGLTLVDNTGRLFTVASNQIEETAESAVSLMPDNLYRQLKPQELRDLFAWLQSNGPSNQP